MRGWGRWFNGCFCRIRQKMGVGGVSALSGARLWPVDKILGATVRIVGLTNGGATNVLFFCVGICSDDGGGNGWGTMPKID